MADKSDAKKTVRGANGGRLNRGGRPRGVKNRMTGAHGDLLAAWDKVSGPITAIKLMKSAVEDAIGVEEPIFGKDGNPILDENGKPYMRTVKSWDGFKSVVPYIARKMPDEIELRQLPTMTPEEIDARWGKRQDRSEK